MIPTQASDRLQITKATFLTGATCSTWGWLTHRKTQEEIGPGLRWRFLEANRLQTFAREWIGEGKLLTIGPTQVALDTTARAIASADEPLLFEASFAADGCIARADAIRKVDGGWELLEIKSGSSKEEKSIKKEYIDDLAYTFAVARRAGLPITRALLVLVNGEFEVGGTSAPFVEEDVTAECLQRATEFERILPMVSAAVAGERPDGALIYPCRHCDFFTTDCVGKGIDDPLFDLPGIREKRFNALAEYQRVSALPPHADLTDNQAVYVEVIRSGVPRVDAAKLAELDGMVWPHWYLDFEAIAPAWPQFEGTRPYQKIPFQYSVHRRKAAGAALEHFEYLAEPAGDWRRDLTWRLLELLGETGSVVVYSNYEEQVLKQLAIWYPDLAPAIERLIARLFDLEKIVKHGYIHPGFRGKSSIKKVLPVIAKDRQNYDGLAVAGGEDAAGIFNLMLAGEWDAEATPQTRSDLLRYCGLDTEAMVLVHDALGKLR